MCLFIQQYHCPTRGLAMQRHRMRSLCQYSCGYFFNVFGVRRRTARLQEFHEKLAKLRFFDPACGCGNFLVITYRELRQLELETLTALYGGQKELTLDEVNRVSQVDVDQFYGIEIEEFPFYDRLPLCASPHIVVGNALRTDWRTVLPPEPCSYR